MALDLSTSGAKLLAKSFSSSKFNINAAHTDQTKEAYALWQAGTGVFSGQGQVKSSLPNTLAGPTGTSSDMTQQALKSAYNTAGNPMYTSSDPFSRGTSNDPSMFDVTGATPMTTSTSNSGTPQPSGGTTQGGSGGGSGTNSILQGLTDAFNASLRAGSEQAQAMQQQMLSQSIQSNQLQSQLNSSISGILQNSITAQQQSADALGKTLKALSSGGSTAQTEFDTVDISAQLDKQNNSRKLLRQRAGSGMETQQAGLLAQKALLAKPTLLG